MKALNQQILNNDLNRQKVKKKPIGEKKPGPKKKKNKKKRKNRKNRKKIVKKGSRVVRKTLLPMEEEINIFETSNLHPDTPPSVREKLKLKGCMHCNEKASESNPIAVCFSCHSIFHLKCSEQDQEDVKTIAPKNIKCDLCLNATGEARIKRIVKELKTMVDDSINPSLVFEKAYAVSVKDDTFYYCEDPDCILRKLKSVSGKIINGIEEWKQFVDVNYMYLCT